MENLIATRSNLNKNNNVGGRFRVQKSLITTLNEWTNLRVGERRSVGPYRVLLPVVLRGCGVVSSSRVSLLNFLKVQSSGCEISKMTSRSAVERRCQTDRVRRPLIASVRPSVLPHGSTSLRTHASAARSLYPV